MPRMGNRTLNHFMRGIGKQMAKQAKAKKEKEAKLNEQVLKEQADRNFKNISRIHINIMADRQEREQNDK